jgi:hypothetical protein
MIHGSRPSQTVLLSSSNPFSFFMASLSANRKIQSIATILRLSEVVSLAATRLYTLAVEHKFTKGRKGVNVVAVCLYVACRQKETKNYMLIDFSDLLQVRFLPQIPLTILIFQFHR